MAEWFRVLDLKSGGPKSSTLHGRYLDLFSVVLSSTARPHCINTVANWSASKQVGFSTVYVLFAIFVYLFTVSPEQETIALISVFVIIF